MPKSGLSPSKLNLDSLGDPGDRYELGELLGSGACGEVFTATDNEAGGKRVAVKIQKVSKDRMDDIQEEYRILRDLSSHPNLPDFYGVYLKKTRSCDQLWFVMQLCEGGPVVDMVRGLLKHNKKMSEEHIAFILHETVKALVHLHENHVMHRDVRGSNILLTKLGEVKLVDFGLSRELKSTMDKRKTCLGSPSWMAPEVVGSERAEGNEANGYDIRADVWSLGITAIELGDGKAPFEGIHPMRALFQIVRNPPPTLYRPASWTQNFNDFITECLEKNPDNRPFMIEIMEHPFLTSLPENDFHLTQELKSLLEMVTPDIVSSRTEEVVVRRKFMSTKAHPSPEEMHTEDLAALEDITEDTVLCELQERNKKGHSYTFVGDILLFINPNADQDIYGFEMQNKYYCKSRSDNAPHIFSVADSAYQDVLHHEEPQHIILSGETMSGKTTNLKHLLNHLNFLGLSPNKVGDKLKCALNTVHAFCNAATPVNSDSTRHIMQLQVTFSTSGKVSGGIFWLYQLEKWRVTTCPVRAHANFHVFYYLYDALESDGTLGKYHLEGGRHYRYLGTDGDSDHRAPAGPREEPHRSLQKFRELEKSLIELDFDDSQRERIYKTLAAILLLGEIEFQKQDDGKAGLANTEIATKVAELLDVDDKKFAWALCNYCVVLKGTAARRKHDVKEARESRDVFARSLYFRLVDWIINTINLKLSFTRAVFGDDFYVNLVDMFGFECYPKNGLEQVFVNTLNEQLQYHYNQRVFVWEMQDQIEEGIPLQSLQYYDNKPTIDELMSKPDGLLYTFDEANKNSQGADYIIEKLQSSPKGPRVKMSSAKEFTVAHYTGKISYDVHDIATKNRDFLPPEMIETMRLSSDSVIKQLFTNQLSKSGNLTVQSDQAGPVTTGKKKRWGAALVAEKQKRKYNTQSRGEYSQTRRMRTASAIFRAASLELLRNLAMGQDGAVVLGGTHFVRCIRGDLTGHAQGFQPEVVRQQLRALAVIDTARARAKGYSHRVSFAEFIRRYKFLAFDFDENVEVTKDNCRLLLVRLKMEGWVIGKSKVFLKYYNEEYLSRLYETQVKKIVKVQCMMRAFLAKRNFKGKMMERQASIKQQSIDSVREDPAGVSAKKQARPKTNKPQPPKNARPPKKASEMSQDEAALVIQTQFRGFQARKQYGPVISSEKMSNDVAQVMKQYCRKWKAKSLFQVLLMYRAAKHQEMVYMCQQVHLYNQNAVSALQISNKERVTLHNIMQDITASKFLGKYTPRMWKLPFRLNDMPFCDSSYLCTTMGKRTLNKDDTPWDDPYKRTSRLISATGKPPDLENRGVPVVEGGDVFSFIQTPYTRDPRDVEVVYTGQPYRKGDHYFTAKSGKERKNLQKSGAPQLPKFSSNANNFGQSTFNGSANNFTPSLSNNSPARSYQPPPPSNNFMNQQYNASDNRSNLKPTGGNQKQNPIRELEMKFQKINNNYEDNEEDTPTFNFQAMLRKTNHNRASLRRSPEMEMASTHGHGSFPIIPEQKSVNQRTNYMNNSNNNNNNVVYNSSASRNMSGSSRQLARQDSGDCRKMMSHHYKESVKKARGNEVTTEIAPGIIIQGQVAEL